MKSTRRISGGNGYAASASLDDQIYRRIYGAIAGQELPPGTRLREDQMRQIFEVSRARIRKVFSRLAFEGLVSIEPNRGASVAKPSAGEAREIFAARRAIAVVLLIVFSPTDTLLTVRLKPDPTTDGHAPDGPAEAGPYD